MVSIETTPATTSIPSPTSSIILPIISLALGWIYTLSWSLSFYPQPLLNVRRGSTSGATPSFPILNTLGFLAYTISTTSFYFSSTIRGQYAARHHGEQSTVRGNDVVFAIHALILSSATLSQYAACCAEVWGLEKRKWRVGRGVWAIIVSCLLAVGWSIGMVILAEPLGFTAWEWIDVIYTTSYIKLLITLIKYIPQAHTNYTRKSTAGWSISQILMDLLGGILSTAQLLIDSSLQGDHWADGVTGNPVKFALGNVSIVFDAVFMVQHFVLYRGHKGVHEEGDGQAETDELLRNHSRE